MNFIKAKWIWINEYSNSDEYAVFCDEFFAHQKKATIRISSDSNFCIYLNGQLAGFSQYPDYPNNKVYSDIDLSEYVCDGKNKLVIVVWYYGKDFFTYIKSNPGILYEVSNDNNILAFSNKNTRSKLADGYISYENKIITNQLGFSFAFDFTKYDEFDSLSYHTQFSNSVEIKKTNELVVKPIKNLILTDLVEAKLIDESKQIYDLGRECVGFLSIKFVAKKGEKVVIAYGEHIDDGKVRYIIGQRNFSISLIGNGEVCEHTFAFRRLGGRYFEVVSGCTNILYIGLKEVYYPDQVIAYNNDNALRKKIYDVSVQTLRLCKHDHYEDCPWREQALYALDTRCQMLYGYYAFYDRSYARAELVHMTNGCGKDGQLSICFPSGINFPIPFFTLAYFLQVSEYIENSKDVSIVDEVYSTLEFILSKFFDCVDEHGLLKEFVGYWNFYEWSDGLHNAPNGNPIISKQSRYSLALNCMFVIALNEFSKITSFAKKKFKYDNQIKNLKKMITKKFYCKDMGLYKSFDSGAHFSVLCNSLAIIAEININNQKDVAESLAKDFIVPCSLSMKVFEYEALIKVDKFYYRERILSEIDKNYSLMLDNGATSFWETLKGANDFDGAGSLCHGWSALPIYFYKILDIKNM